MYGFYYYLWSQRDQTAHIDDFTHVEISRLPLQTLATFNPINCKLNRLHDFETLPWMRCGQFFRRWALHSWRCNKKQTQRLTNDVWRWAAFTKAWLYQTVESLETQPTTRIISFLFFLKHSYMKQFKGKRRSSRKGGFLFTTWMANDEAQWGV